ncbi:alpha/beta-hydrolase [Ceratobasidium sp. AG-I]|nr:alpha/beta-hydrolase [Ceratobasidium sp. AG-I]
MIASVRSAFPQESIDNIRYDLLRSGSIEITSNKILERGYLDRPPPAYFTLYPATPAGDATTTDTPTSAPTSSSSASSKHSNLISRYGLEARTVVETSGEYSDKAAWEDSAAKREASLKERKAQMILAARQPFNISVSDKDLQDLYAKLELTRLPDELDLPPGQEWEWGIPLAVLKPVVHYWRTQYNWRAEEDRINRTLPQFTTRVKSIEHGLQEVHFVHKRSNNPNATPLLFAHGWPGSFLEVSKMIDELANPTNPKHPSFHVVAPSLPGFVFSQRAPTPGMDGRATAFSFNSLMIRLGYKHYLAQGGDWGSVIVRGLAVYHQDNCLGTHQNALYADPPSFLKHPIMALKTFLGFAGLPGGYSEEDIGALKLIGAFIKSGSAYNQIQTTKPQTLAVALTGMTHEYPTQGGTDFSLALLDSPVGLLAWIGEKLYEWTDSYPWKPEELITWTMLVHTFAHNPARYWINGPAGGLRFYKENRAVNFPSTAAEAPIRFQWSPTPLGFSSFPKEIILPPLEWAGMVQNLVYTKKHDKGGHFAAWEVPELLTEDIREFASIVIAKDERLQNTA